jgi:hypothetical protein
MSEASHPVGSATPTADDDARTRPVVTVHVWEVAWPGFAPHADYVRRWWTCAIGPSAVADLLRMARAAADGPAELRRPPTLDRLVSSGLVLGFGSVVVVPVPIRPVGPPLDRRIPHRLRAAHQRDLATLEERSPAA